MPQYPALLSFSSYYFLLAQRYYEALRPEGMVLEARCCRIGEIREEY